MAEAVGPSLDLKAVPNLRDPFAVYRWLQDHEPVRWSDELGGWLVTRYEDVQHVLHRSAEFSSDRFRKLDPRYASQRPDVRAVSEVLSQWAVFRDPPDHTRLRALLQKSFTARQLERSRDAIQHTLDSLLDAAETRPEIDFIRDVAFPLPAMVIATLLGVATDDLDAIKAWSDQLAAYLGGEVGSADNFERARGGLEKLVDYFTRLLPETNPDGEALMSLMLRAEHEGHSLSDDEVVSNCVLLLFAGHETTTNLLGNGLFHLLRHPDQHEELTRNPGMIETAIEEFLRFDGPVPATVKIAARDTSLRGASIRRGDMVIPFLSAANRDPRQFPDPDRLDLGRSPNRHMAFAYGLHFCLGAPLARLEARLVFETLLRRYPRLRLEHPDPRWKPMIFLRGLESLRLSLGS